jgi:sarcosine oxidase subunit gamma
MTTGVTVTVLPPEVRLAVRASGMAVAAIGGAFGVLLPGDACRASTNGSRSALWLGPDEWLLIAPDGELPALIDWIAEALGTTPASLVDVSDRNLAIEVKGEKAAEAINAFNPLDLGLEAFPVGMCTRTVFGKAEIVLWRRGMETFRIEVWRSFAPYVLGCLSEAAMEYGAASE